jgi:hypothetical protein
MADLSLDLDKSSGTYKDLLVLNNDLVLTKDANPIGTNPVLQNILQRLGLFLGEWFLDNTKGVPWLQQILVKNPDIAAIDAIILNTILGTIGVVQLNFYTFTPNFAERTLEIAFTALTTQGKVDYSGTLITGA